MHPGIRSTKSVLNNATNTLLKFGEPVASRTWQGISSGLPMLELTNLFMKMRIEEEIGKATNADLPWAEDHFQERISGVPSNPGEQYKHWPYYSEADEDRFRGKGQFSHTYQERFWPPKRHGIRFTMGDYQDVKKKLQKNPETRQAFLSIWHPEDQSPEPERRVPCTIGYWFYVVGGQLDVTYLIRSCDAARHFRNDIYMAQRLAQDMAESLPGITPRTLSVWIGSFHCFTTDKIFLLKKCQ